MNYYSRTGLIYLIALSVPCLDGTAAAWQPNVPHSRLFLNRRQQDVDQHRKDHHVPICASQSKHDSPIIRLPSWTRGVACATMAAGLAVCVPTTATVSWIGVSPAAAAMELTTDTTSTSTTTIGASTSSSLLSSQALTSSLLALGVDDTDAGKQDESAPKTALDEAWTLINKYYIDRSFQGQDWMAVKRKYDQALERQPDQEQKLVTEMVQSLQDRYSRMLSADQYAAIQKYDLIGVGATLMPNAEKQIMVGAPPIPGSAAAKAGLQVGDVVQAVNGKPTEGRTAFDIIDQIAQEDVNAETITLTIRKSGDTKADAVDYTLDRAFQKVINPIQYKVTERRSDGTVVGYVRISEFNAIVKPKLEQALQDLTTKQGANALVLDLRGNGGGAFQSAVEIASLFLNQQIATYVVDGTTAEIPFPSAADRVVVEPTAPLVLWMDGRTASASEVLAAALHDNCRATLAGTTSYGKGLIQAVYGLKNGDGLVLTVAKYVTPKHDEIQGIGLQPDVEGMVPNTFLPGLYTSDTSSVDFQKAMKQHLNMCMHPPPPSVKTTTTLTDL